MMIAPTLTLARHPLLLGVPLLALLSACGSRVDHPADTSDPVDTATVEDTELDGDADPLVPDTEPSDAADSPATVDTHPDDTSDAAQPDDTDAGPTDTVETDGDTTPDPWAVFGYRLLGATLEGDTVTFTLFAPQVEAVAVAGEFNDWEPSETPMRLDAASGVWTAEVVLPDAHGQEYQFVLDGETWVPDPYARANRQHRGNSIIWGDDGFVWSDADFARPTRAELVIYEMHVTDFTSAPSSGIDAERAGRYLGVIDRIDHLQRLGVNAVELLPVSESQSNEYGWGYNPALLFAPEAGYATDEGGAQVLELKAVIDALHAAGIAVILDVVYNHISGTERDNPLWEIDANYYLDYDDDGDPDNDRTPWGFKLATWRPMVQKLLYDNMRYWMDTYHVDGFRLDSTENVHLDAVAGVVRALKADGYGDRYYIFEEFSGDHNERIRGHNDEEGEALISSWGGLFRDAVWPAMIQGASNDGSLGPATYYSRDQGWRYPAAVINYASSHDEGTLAGRHDAEIAQVRVVMAHLLTSLGIPMFWMGDEMARLHYGNHHPEGGDAHLAQENNVVDWSYAETNSELIDYVGALVRLRVQEPSLRLADHALIGAHFDWIVVDWGSAIGYAIQGLPGGRDALVLLNYQDQRVEFPIEVDEPGEWWVMAEGDEATHEDGGLRTIELEAEQLFGADAVSAVVLMRAERNE